MKLNGVKVPTELAVFFTLGTIGASSFLIFNAAIDNGVDPFNHALSGVEITVGTLPHDGAHQVFDGYAKNSFVGAEIAALDDAPVVDILAAPEHITVAPADLVEPVEIGFATPMPEDVVPANFGAGVGFPDGMVKNPDFTGEDIHLASLTPGELIDASVIFDAEEEIKVSGILDFVSADTAMVEDTLIRFDGVHGPSSEDLCETASGNTYDCASWSLAGMRTIVAEREVSCTVLSRADIETGAHYASCNLTLRNGSERSLAEVGLESGILVLADQEDPAPSLYDAQEKARQAGNGVWSGVYEYAKNENNEKESS